MSDRFGRKPVIMAAAGTLLGASLCAAGSQSLPLFVLARFVIAGSASATSLILFTLVFEVTGNERRALHTLWATSIGGTVPLPLLQLVNLIRPSWELAQAVFLLPTVLQMMCCNFLEESPSWLVATSQLRRAQQVVVCAARMNRLDVSKATQAFQRLKRHIRTNDQGHSITASALSSGTAAEGALQAAMFRRRALSVAIAWFNITFVFYYLAIMAAKTGGHDKAVHFGMQTLTFIGICWLLTKKGQRESLTVAVSAVAVCAGAYFAASVLSLSSLIPSIRSVVLCFCTGALAICYGYTAEVFPVSIRSTGICLSYTAGRLGALLSSFLSEFKGVPDSAAMQAAMAALMLVTAVAVQWLPEVFLNTKTTKPPKPAVLSPAEQKKALKASLAASPSPRKQNRRRKERGQSTVSPKRSGANKMEPKSLTERSPPVFASVTPKN
ncbi:hypothetical protein V5799_006367 [Amblyomma americanum]|uniref:Major facilitator superfamily (MFS) profile domain-containing protein n=1 Tax=Amblyomma americanum TaxID=6943 RepID=A0AAQ4DWL0_AMBAM